MQNLHIELLSITHTLEESPTGTPQQLLQFAFYPEFISFGHKDSNLLKQGKQISKAITQNENLDIFSKRALPDKIDQDSLNVTVELSRNDSSPISLKVPYLYWEHNGHTIAFLPSLGIEVVTTQSHLKDEIISQTEIYLKRTGKIKDLLQLALIQRKSDVSIERLHWNPTPLSAKDYYKRNYESEDQAKQILKEVATRISAEKAPPAYQRKTETANLFQNFSKKHPNSILLVGPAGCGKTAVLNQLVKEYPAKMPTFWKTSGSRLIAGQTGYGMWQQRCRDLIDEVKNEPVALYLGNLFELMQVGQSSSSTESIASYLRPYIERGDIIAVTECTADQYSAIELNDPKLLDAFKRFPIEEPSPEKSLKILQDLADEFDDDHCLTSEVIATIHSLHQRFARYSAQPGRALLFTKSLIEQSPSVPYSTSQIIRQFSKESGLPTVILDDSESFCSEKVTDWFQQRVMAQPKAVDKVVTMLTTVKSRLSRPNKPLGSFMFIGPTGVGKTEMAKTIAEYLYGDKDRIIRFDMSEYNYPQSAQRLVSDSFSQKEGLLTAAVREQPFSIILLDEFEKGAPEIYDLFLQVLGEGRLTDGSGRLADFSNAIIILTSNLGAQTFNSGSLGFQSSNDKESHAESHFSDAVKKEVRPEFFNRIDHIVPFSPLNLESIKNIAERELRLILKRDGLYYLNYAIDIEPQLLADIISSGYDIRYGARPLKRAIEQRVLLPLAHYLDSHQPTKNGTFLISAKNENVVIAFDKTSQTQEESSTSQKRLQLDQIALLAKHRRLLHRLDHSSMLSELKSEVFRIQQRITWQKKRALKELARDNLNRRRMNIDSVHVDFDPIEQARLSELEDLISEVSKTSNKIIEQEEKALLQLYAGQVETPGSVNTQTIESLILRTFSLHEDTSPYITLLFHSDSFDWLLKLIQVYTSTLHARGMKTSLGLIHRVPKKDNIRTEIDEDNTPVEFQIPERMTLTELQQAPKKLHKSIHSIALEIKSKEASLLLRSESGLHRFEFEENKYHRALITVHTESLDELDLPLEDSQTTLSLKNIAIRREYEIPLKYHDTFLPERGTHEFSSELLDRLLRTTLMREANSMLD